MTSVSASASRTPEVSIVIPVYNTEVYLVQCVESVLAQTGVSLEVVCVDDGSTDSSATILQALADRDDRVTVVQQTNGGLSRARNAGLEVASGRYVCFLDSDDYWTTDQLASLLERAQRDHLDVLMFDAQPLREAGTDDDTWRKYQEYYTRSAAFEETVSGAELMARLRENEDYLPSACLYLVRRQLLTDHRIRFYPGIAREDNLFTFAVMLRASRAAHEPCALYVRRVRPGSIMTAGAGVVAMQGHFVTYLEMTRMLAGRNLPPPVAVQFGKLVATMYRYTREGFIAAPPEERRRLAEVDQRPDAKAVVATLRMAARDARTISRLRAENKTLAAQARSLRKQLDTLASEPRWRTVARATLPASVKSTLKRLRAGTDGTGRPVARVGDRLVNSLRSAADLEAQVFNPGLPLESKLSALKALRGTASFLEELLASLTPTRREAARHQVRDANLQLVNLSFLAELTGIAFCQNFSPFRDASAYVAAKRLPQLETLVGSSIAWHVISADLSYYHGVDDTFDQFYARYRRARHTQLPSQAHFNERSQHRWARRALAAVKDTSVPIVYSRSMWPGSHEAAAEYKQAHPETAWYAEFSDPIYLDIHARPRPATRTYRGAEEWLNDYWLRAEQFVYDDADHIIFTNTNQRDVMLGRLDPATADSVTSRSMVLHHPRLDPRWSDVLPADYRLDPNLINIGYFGSFYSSRKAEALLAVADDPRICLHLFVPTVTEIRLSGRQRVRVNAAVDHLRMLSIGKSMDYLLLSDVEYPGALNPYLPSKLADYLSTGTPVLAVAPSRSALATVGHPSLQLVSDLSPDMLATLSKRSRS